MPLSFVDAAGVTPTAVAGRQRLLLYTLQAGGAGKVTTSRTLLATSGTAPARVLADNAPVLHSAGSWEQLMSTDSWLDSNRTTGPLHFAKRMGVDRPTLQRGALRAPNSRPQVLVERADAGTLHAAELRCPLVNGALMSLRVEIDGATYTCRSWTLSGNEQMACAVMQLDPPLTFKRSLRIWVAADPKPLPWVAIEIAIDPGQLATTERVC